MSVNQRWGRRRTPVSERELMCAGNKHGHRGLRYRFHRVGLGHGRHRGARRRLRHRPVLHYARAPVTCPHGEERSTCPTCAGTLSSPGTDEEFANTLLRDSSPDQTVRETAEPTTSAGGRIGRFVIVDTIGQGGMGVVYSAYDPALDRRVAIKLLRQGGGGSQDSGGTARLAREAQAMARLSHPNVVPVYDVGRFGDSLFVAMEFVDGVTLHEWLKQSPRSWRDVVAVFLAAGRGLDAAHRAGIVHRDFKPANVLVGADGRTRVTDFGLARSVHGELPPESASPQTPAISLDTPLTMRGSVMGTPGYMAPEQYLGQQTSPATDQFAFCVSLYEALYGARPFKGTDLATLQRLTQSGEVPPPPKGSTVPAWLFPIIAKGLTSDPLRRHPSMRALLSLLERDPSAQRRRWALAGGAALLTLGVAAGLWSWPRVRASSCHRDTERLATVWNDEARQNAERAFKATGQPFAATAWDFTRATLDTFTAAWVAERHAACDETLRLRERTEAQLELRLRCLDGRRVELQTLSTRFQAADAELVAQAATAVARLSPVAQCGNLASLEARAQLPIETRRAVEAVDRQLAEARMLIALAAWSDARARLLPAIEEARRSNDAQTLALALLELAALERDEDHFQPSRAALDEALRLSLSVRDDRTALHAIALLASVVGWRLERPAEALTLVNVGRGLVPRVGDPLLEALLHEGEADAHWQRGARTEALAAYRLALPLFEREEGPAGLDVARVLSSIGWVLMEEGHFSEARAAYEQSRRSREALLGADHPALAPTWNELGNLAEFLGDLPAAASAMRRGAEMRAKRRGAITEETRRAQLNLVRVLTAQGLLDEAAALLADIESALTDRDLRSTHLGVVEARSRLLLAQGRAPEAEAAARRGLAEVKQLLGEEHPSTLAMALELHRALVAQQRAGEGLDLALHVLAIEERRHRIDSPDFVRFLNAVVESRLALGSNEALATSERAATTVSNIEGNAMLKAQTHLLLAKARWKAAQQEEALAAAQAAAGFAAQRGAEAVRADVAAWLAAHTR